METMTQSEFFKILIDYYKGRGFSFFVPGEQFVNQDQMSLTKRTVFKAIAGVAMTLAVNPGLGIVTSLTSFNLSAADKESLIKDLEQMHNHCDLVGIKISDAIAPAMFICGIVADDISNESLIGRFVNIHEQAHNFIKYSPSTMFGKKNGVRTSVCVVFSSHKRAKDFIENAAKKCKHSAFWKKVDAWPWLIDLEEDSEKISTKLSPQQ
jgi:hypothetical protein